MYELMINEGHAAGSQSQVWAFTGQLGNDVLPELAGGERRRGLAFTGHRPTKWSLRHARRRERVAHQVARSTWCWACRGSSANGARTRLSREHWHKGPPCLDRVGVLNTNRLTSYLTFAIDKDAKKSGTSSYIHCWDHLFI